MRAHDTRPSRRPWSQLADGGVWLFPDGSLWVLPDPSDVPGAAITAADTEAIEPEPPTTASKPAAPPEPTDIEHSGAADSVHTAAGRRRRLRRRRDRRVDRPRQTA